MWTCTETSKRSFLGQWIERVNVRLKFRLQWHQQLLLGSHTGEFNNVIYVFLLLWLCILIVCLYTVTLTEVFPCFFLSCKSNARVKPAKRGTARILPSCCIVLCIFCVLCIIVLFVLWRSLYCLLSTCVLNNCHRVATQLQLNTGCPTTYQTRHFFNNSKANEDTATRFEQEYVRCVRNEEECVCSVCLFRCNIFIGFRIIKEMPGSVASGTPYISYHYCRWISTHSVSF